MSYRAVGLVAALMLAVGVIGCDTQPPGTPNGPGNGPRLATAGTVFQGLDGTAASESNPIPLSWARAKSPVEPAPAQKGGSSALLNEVCFRPKQGASQWVELRAAAGGTSPSGLVLKNGAGQMYVLPGGIASLGGGELLSIVFDGGNSVDGKTVHAAISSFLNTNSDLLTLLDANNVELDRVVWGEDRGDAVPYGRTGAPYTPEDGMTLGRLPGATQVGASAWTVFPPERTTAGKPNIQSGVEIVFPLNGSIGESGETMLSWYPVMDAVSYRLRLSTKADLSAPIVDETVTEPMITRTLGVGTYYWQVQAVFADGSAADWSPLSIFALDDAFDLSESGTTSRTKADGTRKVKPTLVISGVPWISQHKDTTMICTESDRVDAGHEWDQPHAALNVHDPADGYNCSIASTAMINRKFGGTLSQDRIGYELNKNRRPGPEGDVNYGHGNWIEPVLGWSIGRAGDLNRSFPATFGDFWNTVVFEIGKGRPLVLIERIGAGTHATVICGYDTSDGVHLIANLNPWNPGSAKADFKLRQYDLISVYCVYVLGDGPLNGIADDPLILQDTDHDGVNDFDEVMRFGTDKDHADTDNDCADDKTEIRASMFDPDYGWALFINHGGANGAARYREATMSGAVPTAGRPELDVDFDRDGLPDFLEDQNHDGVIADGETSPFYVDEHRALAVRGFIDDVIDTHQDFSDPNYDNTTERFQTHIHAQIDLVPDFDSGKLIGTAQVTWRRNTQFVFRDQTCADGLNIDTNVRQWTVSLTGQLFCGSDGKIGVLASGTPNGSDVPQTLHYYEYNCHCPPCYDVTEPKNSRPTWGSLFESGFFNNRLDLRNNRAVTPPLQGEDYHDVHLMMLPYP